MRTETPTEAFQTMRRKTSLQECSIKPSERWIASYGPFLELSKAEREFGVRTFIVQENSPSTSLSFPPI